jgi:hypothetical protein
MTGPEHYGKAEELLAADASQEDADATSMRLAAAAVHATLALAAATAWAARHRSPGGPEVSPWMLATGPTPSAPFEGPRPRW